jgi:hypothetical protein
MKDQEAGIIGKIEAHTNNYDADEILAFKHRVRDCVWFDGAILKHQDPGKIFFAPEPNYGVRFELHKSDVVELLPNGTSAAHLGETFTLVKLFLPKNALVTRISHHFAFHLLPYVEELRAVARHKRSQTEGQPFTDLRTAQSSAGNDGAWSPEPSPSRSPELRELSTPKEPPIANMKG